MGATMQDNVAVPSMDVGGPAQWLTVSGGQPVISNTAPAAAPPPAPTNTNTNTGPTPEQIAAQQKADALAKATTNYQNSLAANMANVNLATNTGGGDYSDFIKSAYGGTNGFGDRQATLNASAIQNELSRDQGLQGVRDMVNNGVQGAGVMLDNAGAGTSSAGDAVARAYGIQGRQQASHVGNQYAQGQATIQSNQDNLGRDENTFNTSTAPAHKADIINQIVSNATQAIQYIDLQAQSAGVADIPALQAQRAQIQADATAALSQYDSTIGSQLAANQPASQEANQAEASRRFAQGVAPTQAFNFTNTAPASFQNTGPSASSLPIFIAPSNKTNLPTAV